MSRLPAVYYDTSADRIREKTCLGCTAGTCRWHALEVTP